MKRKIKFLNSLKILRSFRSKHYSRLSLLSLQYSFFLKKRASLARLKRRCFFSGFSRSHIRFFGLSRQTFRQLALSGKLLGVRKSSF